MTGAAIAVVEAAPVVLAFGNASVAYLSSMGTLAGAGAYNAMQNMFNGGALALNNGMVIQGGATVTGALARYQEAVAGLQIAAGNLSSFAGNSMDQLASLFNFIETDGSSGSEGTRSTVKTNLGNEIDITPSSNHSTTTKNPGYKGTPNSSIDIIDDAGNVQTRRWFGSDGKAIKDVDMTNHGNPKYHPEWPHEHFWEYGPDGKPINR